MIFAHCGPSPPFAESLPQSLCFGPKKVCLAELMGTSPCKRYFWQKNFGGFGRYPTPPPPPFFLEKSVKLYLKGSLYVRLKCVNAVKAVTVVLAQLQKREEKKIVAVAHLRRKKGVALASREKHASQKKIKKNPLTCTLQGQLATPEQKNSSVKKQRTKR